jgi:hypothetical protein
MSDKLHPIQIERIRQMSLSERFGRGLAFLRSAREFVAAGVKARHPEWTEEEALAEARRLMRHGGK